MLLVLIACLFTSVKHRCVGCGTRDSNLLVSVLQGNMLLLLPLLELMLRVLTQLHCTHLLINRIGVSSLKGPE
jgi:hypothetical protein